MWSDDLPLRVDSPVRRHETGSIVPIGGDLNHLPLLLHQLPGKGRISHTVAEADVPEGDVLVLGVAGDARPVGKADDGHRPRPRQPQVALS